MVFDLSSEKEKAIISINREGYELIAYYIDDYLCSYYDGTYEVIQKEFNYEKETPLPDFDFDKIKYKLQTKETSNKVIYTLKIDGSDVKEYIEDVLDQSILNINSDLELEIITKKDNNQLEEMKLKIEYDGEDYDTGTKLELYVKVNTIGDEVVIEIPEEVYEQIEFYKKGSSNPNDDINLEPEPNPFPYPVKDKYNDTNDGVIKYYEIDLYKDVCYDSKTNQIIVMRNDRIEIYDADTMELRKTINTLLTLDCMDADEGMLVVGYRLRRFDIYDLANYTLYKSVQTKTNVSEIVLDGKIVIYTDDYQWCDIIFYDYEIEEVIEFKRGIYKPKLTLNRKEHILYVTETGLSSSELYYFNSITGEQIYCSNFSEFVYVNNPVLFDGKYIHHEGKTFNRFNGTLVSNNYLNKNYPKSKLFTPYITLYDSEKIAFVGSVENYVGIYDNKEDDFIYKFPLINGRIIKMNDGKFLGICGEKNYLVIINVKLLNKDYATIPETDEQYDNVKLITTKTYIQSMVDDKYLYLLDANGFKFYIYDLKTFEKVKEITSISKIVTFDVYNGKLVIGYGDSKQFSIYDTNTFTEERITTSIPVYSVVIYDEKIIYSEIDQHCDIYIYYITTQNHIRLDYMGYYVSLAMDRENGIVYIGNSRTSHSELVYYYLITNELKSVHETNDSKKNVYFDGNFVHYDGKVFDRRSGLIISSSAVARLYENPKKIKIDSTVFDNEKLSIYTGIYNDEYVTVIYV